MVDTGGVTRRTPAGPTTRQPTHTEALSAVISPRRATELAAGLWLVAGATGALAAALPHGPGVHVAVWWGLAGAALAVGTWWRWRGARLSPATRFLVSLGGVLGVGGAILGAGSGPTAFAAPLLFVVLTVAAACFYPPRALAVFLAVVAATSGGTLLASHVPGAGAVWAAVVLSCGAVAGCVRTLTQALGRAANTDPLTGLANRRALEPLLERELARCGRLGHPLSVAVIDLDGFKAVNDTHGHHGGDRLLVAVTRAWRSGLRVPDVLARSGGDEFLLLLPSTPASAAVAVLERLRRLHDQPFSAGVAEAQRDPSAQALLRRADAACYRAKQRGRGRTVVADAPAVPLRLAAVGGRRAGGSS
jgi:diguanylate cyclase (GGDEF)-like protein